MEFAIGKQQDGSYIVIFRKEDTEDLREIGIIHKDALIAKLFRVSDIEDVKQIVQEQRQSKEAERKTEKQEQKNYGRIFDNRKSILSTTLDYISNSYLGILNFYRHKIFYTLYYEPGY